jgi:nucleoside-diphosphate-sugar epimerase
MRVVVTGATGNVGTSVVAALGADPEVAEVIGVARRVPSLSLPRTRWRAADVTTADLAALFDGADAVVHLAWQLQPARDPRHLEGVNVGGTGRVMEAVARAGVPALIYASSVGAYSAGLKRPVDENWPTAGIPTSVYSRQKAKVERLLDAFEEAHPQVRVVRLRKGLVFKREAASEIARLFLGTRIPLAWVARLRTPLLPVTRRLAVQAVHSLDAGEAYRLAVRGDVRGPINIAADPVVDGPLLARLLGARPVRIPEFALRMAVQATWRARLQPTEPGWIDLAHELPLMDTSRAGRELGWTPCFSAEEALRELFDGIRERCGVATAPLAPQGGAFLEPRIPLPAGPRPAGWMQTPHAH